MSMQSQALVAALIRIHVIGRVAEDNAERDGGNVVGFGKCVWLKHVQRRSHVAPEFVSFGYRAGEGTRW